MSKKRFRILLRNLMYLRNFEAALRSLAQAGHDIHITTSAHDRKVPGELQGLADRLEADFDNVLFGVTTERADWWGAFDRRLHNLRNLLRYRHREYAGAPALVGRSEIRVSRVSRLLFPRWLTRFPPVVRALAGLAELAARAVPCDKAILDELADERPDALIVSPLVDLESEQVDWVRAARQLGIPSCLAVASWDNLTNKGLIQARPDRTILWNRFQKREAIDMHGVAPDDVIVTGAQLYDEWFSREPSRDYETFCRALGFDPARPLLLYCGSSIFIARNEAEFVARWLKQVRNSSEESLRTANILIRPHPMHQVPFEHLDVSGHERVAIHPRSGGMPVDEDNKADFFDALHHCRAVVGINTSALIEAAILGKRSFTVDDPSYQKTQEGTLHFRYLIDGGVLRKSATFEGHVADLAEEFARPDDGGELRAFVQEFLRPNGMDKPATPIFAEAVASIAEIKPASPRQGAGVLLLRMLLVPLAALVWLFDRGHDATLDFRIRLFRHGLMSISRIRRRDAVMLLARRVPLDYEKVPIEILATSPKESATRTRSVMKEPWTVHWLEQVVQPGELVYDIGANVGAYSLVATLAHDRRVKVLAFEPGFSTYAALCRNILHNRCEKTITPLPLALYSKSGSTVFKYRNLDAGEARHAIGARGLATKDLKATKPVYEQTMVALAIDDLIEQFDFQPPNHIKLDVDGAELDILRGASRTLENDSVRSVMVELHGEETATAITDLLRQHGFHMARQFDKLGSTHGFDAFFARDGKAVAAIMANAPDKPVVVSD